MLSWNDFKKEVDRQLEEKGINPDENIFWIDTHFPHKPVDLEVGRDPERGIIVSSF